MIKHKLHVAALVVAAVAFGGENGWGQSGLYGGRIVVETSPADKVTLGDKWHGLLLSPQETAEELAHWLEAMSGKKFEVLAAAADNRTSAIYLLRGDSSLVAAADRERLKNKGPEAFIIRGDSSRLQMIFTGRLIPLCDNLNTANARTIWTDMSSLPPKAPPIAG